MSIYWQKEDYKTLDDYFDKDQNMNLYNYFQDLSLIEIYIRIHGFGIENIIPDSYIHEIDKILEKEFDNLEITL